MSVNRPLTGAEYIESLKDGREVWIYEEKVKDVTEHPAFRNPIRSIARLYDSLHEPTGHDGSMPTAETDTVSGGVAAEERVKTLKMLWDAVGTEFGGRHELYERNYQGNHEQIRVSIFGAGEGRGWNKQLVAFAEQAMSEYDTEGWTLPELQLSPGDLGPRGPPVCGAAPDRKTATLSGAAPHEFRSICQPGAVPVLSLSAAGPESFWSRGTQGPFRLGPARHTANSVWPRVPHA